MIETFFRNGRRASAARSRDGANLGRAKHKPDISDEGDPIGFTQGSRFRIAQSIVAARGMAQLIATRNSTKGATSQ
jgi:hypothetical protein